MKLSKKTSPKKLRFLITSGPTQEPLDPVRYLSNYSTGTIGKYLSEAALKKGHKVTWLNGAQAPWTACELLTILKKQLPKHDVLIMAAAVCDVRPKRFSSSKIKKDKLSSIELIKNPDLLAELSKIKKPQQKFIGFALESENLITNALKKLTKKNLELIVLQKVTAKNTPFGDKKIDATLLGSQGQKKAYKSISKASLAKILIQTAEQMVLLHYPNRQDYR